MPRPPAIVPNTHLHTTLPPVLATRLEILLWSEVEGRVPRGAYQTFLIARIQEFFDTKRVDLSPYLNTSLGEVVVSGSPHSIDKLITRLKGGSYEIDATINTLTKGGL